MTMSPSNPSSSRPCGHDLAVAVADRLLTGKVLAHTHREYGGVGLQFQDGVFVVSEVFDGQLLTCSQALRARQQGLTVEFLSFPERAEFVAWLAQQSDDTLSGRDHVREWLRDNQRLTRSRLMAFVA
jgi:hypothetical protein